MLPILPNQNSLKAEIYVEGDLKNTKLILETEKEVINFQGKIVESQPMTKEEHDRGLGGGIVTIKGWKDIIISPTDNFTTIAKKINDSHEGISASIEKRLNEDEE